ncbi:MAG: type II toxin-antitoxin system PemK/MazF family toxin [Chloroflexi bacterium]|nr:type II toxin-antitoxin system PemK/MazF family toxin [Chloroflexota bacterium]
MRRGEVWRAKLPPPYESRPVLLLHRDPAYAILTTIIVAEITRTIRLIPSCVLLTKADGMPYRCEVNLDNIFVVPKDVLSTYVTALRLHKMQAVDDAIRFALAL